MLPAPQSSHPTPTNECGINSIPEHISGATSFSPCLPWLCDKDDETCYTSRLYIDAATDVQKSTALSNTEAIVMSEVADFVQTCHCDEFWAPRNTQPKRIPPTANQILHQIRDPHAQRFTPTSGAASFNILLNAIALQLLASCYTLLPASSACQLPLFQQRTRPRSVTALRLHSQHRFEPAAGHHARASSETTCWPGLYTGPALEDQLAEVRSTQRLTKRKSNFVPHFAASGWLDGPSSPQIRRVPADFDSSASSNSSQEQGFFSRLICQVSVPKDPRRRHNTLFTRRSSTKGKHQKDTLSRQVTPQKSSKTHLKPLQSLTARAAQRIPSAFRLRRTQSAPRITADDIDTDIPSISRPRVIRKHSSNPSIGSPLYYPFEIPDIHRTLATPARSRFKKGISTSVRVCGRGDMIVASEPIEESRISFAQSDSILTRAQISSILSPSAISPLNISDVALSRREPPTDYFTSVHAATHIDEDKDNDITDEDDLTKECEDAGPKIDEFPVLEEIFARIDAPDKYTSDSDDGDLDRGRKRKTLLGEPGSADCAIVEEFRRKCLEQELEEDMEDEEDEDEEEGSEGSVIHHPRP